MQPDCVMHGQRVSVPRVLVVRAVATMVQALTLSRVLVVREGATTALVLMDVESDFAAIVRRERCKRCACVSRAAGAWSGERVQYGHAGRILQRQRE
jgi:hypothetical protein